MKNELSAYIDTSVRERIGPHETKGGVIAAAVEGLKLRCYAKLTEHTEKPTLFVSVEQLDRHDNVQDPPIKQLVIELHEDGAWRERS